MNHFPETLISNKNKVTAKLGYSNCATKSYLKIAKGVQTSDFAKKTDVAGLKAGAEKLGFDKLKTDQNNQQKPNPGDIADKNV